MAGAQAAPKKRSGSISLAAGCELTFESMALRSNPSQLLGNRDSSSGSEECAENVWPAKERDTTKQTTRQAARRSKSERLQGTKPRIKRRDRNMPLDLACANNNNSGSCGLTGSNADPNGDNAHNSFLRKAPSAGRLLNESYETPDGSPHGVRRQGSTRNRPPLPSVSAVPAFGTPDASPSAIRKFNSPSHASISRLTQRNSERSLLSNRPKESWKPADASGSHRRTGSVRALANTSATGTPNSITRRSAYLDVPDTPDDDPGIDEDSYRLRSFDLTRKGMGVSKYDLLN